MIGSDNKKKGIGMNDLGVDLYIFVRFGDKKELGDYTLAKQAQNIMIHYHINL